MAIVAMFTHTMQLVYEYQYIYIVECRGVIIIHESLFKY